MPETMSNNYKIEKNHKLEFNLKTAKRILSSLLINTDDFPETLTEDKNSISCKRNLLIGNCILAIEELQKEI